MANKITPSAGEQSENPAEIFQQMLDAFVKASSFAPVMICGVNRKVNIGNFENIDVYSGVSVPVQYDVNSNDYLEFKKACEEAAKIGYAIASKETLDRYTLIKNAQGGGRPQ